MKIDQAQLVRIIKEEILRELLSPSATLVDKLKSMGKEVKGGWILINDVLIDIVSSDEQSVRLNSITIGKEKRGQGAASELLDEILRLADYYDVEVYATVQPYGPKEYIGLNKQQLLSWYLRHGFKQRDKWNIVYIPKNNK
jgi:ribosomal protein S18 acetylase RimI-like enzyme